LAEARSIIGEIERFRPIDGNWLKLDALLVELWETGDAPQHVRDLFSLLERFPEEDGAGVIWSVVHGLESIQGYEVELLQSLRRKPSRSGIALATRLLNGGVQHVGESSLIEVLVEVSRSDAASSALQKQADRFLQRWPGG